MPDNFLNQPPPADGDGNDAPSLILDPNVPGGAIQGDLPFVEGGDAFTGIDPNSLPPDLQTLYKSMQADYTKKTQEVASKSKAAEMSAEKAKALDRAFTDPAFRAALFGNQQAQEAQGQQQGNGFQVQPDELDSINPADHLKEDLIPAVQAAAWKAVQKRLFPVLDQYKGIVDHLYRENIKMQWNLLEQKYPGATPHLEAVSAFIQRNPNVSLEQALRAVAPDNLFIKVQNQSRSNPQQDLSKTQGNGRTNGQSKNVMMNRSQVAGNNARPSSEKVDLVTLIREARGGSGW